MYSIMAKMPTLGSLANQDYPNIQEAKIKMFGSSSFLLNHKFSRFGENHVIRTREYFSHRKKRRRRRNSDVTAFRKPYLQPLSSVAKDPSSGLPQLLGFLSVSAQVTWYGPCLCPCLLPSPTLVSLGFGGPKLSTRPNAGVDSGSELKWMIQKHSEGLVNIVVCLCLYSHSGRTYFREFTIVSQW